MSPTTEATAQPRVLAGREPQAGYRLRRHGNPVRQAFAADTWRAAWYLTGYVLATGWIMFAIGCTAVVTAAVLAISLAGIPLLVAAAAVVRNCASVERRRLGAVFAEPVAAPGQPPAAGGLLAQAKASWQDRSVWCSVGYVVGMWVPLLALDTIVLSIWLAFLAGVTLPAWYWAPRGSEVAGYVQGTRVHGVALGYFPHGPAGPGAVGLYVDTLPKALLAAAVFAVLFLLFSSVLVATAQLHGRVARALLRAPADPLAPAKNVLALPGPLGPPGQGGR